MLSKKKKLNNYYCKDRSRNILEMDKGLNTSKYNAYNLDAQHDPGFYNSHGVDLQDGAVTGTPLYLDEARENPQLGRFVTSGCKDLWAALLFLGVVGASICWGVVNMVRYKPFFPEDHTSDSSNKIFGKSITVVALSILSSIFASIFSSAGFLALVGMFPRQVIYVANILTILVSLASSVVLLVNGQMLVGAVTIIMALLNALWLFLVRHRIPFSAELLKASSDVLMKYKCVFVFSLLLCGMSVVYFFFWFAMVRPTVDGFQAKSSGAGDVALILFFLLVIFWFMQVVPNIMHVTTAGVTATWYFAGGGRMPRNPTLASFKRASTTSFGSICFGSLIVAILNVIKAVVRNAVEQQNEFVRCIALCIVSCLESMLEYFNTYAFVHVAVYGCSYIEAAKRTWTLCKQCFFAAYFNDALVGQTLGLFTFFASLVIGAVIGLINWSVAIGACAFVIAVALHSLFLSAVGSAVTTFFVCFAEVPEGLQHSAPDLYAALHNADQNGTNNNAPQP